MSGYIDHSRSVRSQEAIDSYEVPYSHIKKSLLNKYFDDYEHEYTRRELKTLKKFTLTHWRYACKNLVEPSSWHHTGCHFNCTDHYSLFTIASTLIEKEQEILAGVKDVVKSSRFQYAVISVATFSGTVKRPKFTGNREYKGLVNGDNFYYLKEPSIIQRFKVSANKTNWVKKYKTYDELVTVHKQFNNSKRYFNKLIKLKGVKS